jgi:hypothetical protein
MAIIIIASASRRKSSKPTCISSTLSHAKLSLSTTPLLYAPLPQSCT